MKANRVLRASAFAVLLAFFLLPAAAHAANVTVGCGGVSGTYDFATITAALNAIGQTGPSTITVTGTCQENVSLNNARSITIISSRNGASIVGPLDTDAFDISLSQDITLWSLDISGTFSTTANGGGAGVSITKASDVRILGCNIHDNQAVGVNADTGSILFLQGTTIQNNTPNDGLDVAGNSTADVAHTTIQNNGSPGGNGLNGGVGVFVGDTSSVLFRRKNSILNNADIGILAANLSHVQFQNSGFPPAQFTTIQGHNTNGIVVKYQSVLRTNTPTVIQGNGAACPLDPSCGGILVLTNSTAVLNRVTVSGNHGSGISAQEGADVRLTDATISNNTGDGVHIQWISIGDFIPGSGTAIIGNGGKSVFCDTTSLAVGDLSEFSNVGCPQIARSIGPPRPGTER